MSSIYFVNSIDASIPRKAQADLGHYVVTLCYEDQKPIEKVLRFESYYDAQCSVRGNYWSWREIGKQTDYDSDTSIEINDKNLGLIQFSLIHDGTLLIKPWANRPLHSLFVNRNEYFYLRSKGRNHIYQAGGNKYPDLKGIFKKGQDISLT